MRRLIVTLVFLALTLAPAEAAAPIAAPRPRAETPAAGDRTTLVRRHHRAPVVLILMENHSYSQIIGNTSAPYMNAFARHGELFTNMNAISHPSLPNYLALTSGSTLGCTSDKCPTNSFRSKNIFFQLRKHHRRWHAWEDSMPSSCLRTNAGPYAVRHNPPPYYTDLVPRDCRRHDVAYPSRLPARIPGFTFITPNTCNDIHSCAVSVGDTWLSKHVPPLLRRGAIVVITFDEGEGDNHVYCAVRGPGAGRGVRRIRRYTHYSVLAGIERHFGLPRLHHAATARPIRL